MMLDGRMTGREKFILTRLALHRNLKSGRCDPTHDTLALECSLSDNPDTDRDIVRRALRKAEKLGWIRRNYRHGGAQLGGPHDGRQLNRSNAYELKIPRDIFDNAMPVDVYYIPGTHPADAHSMLERGDKNEGARGQNEGSEGTLMSPITRKKEQGRENIP